MRTVQKRTGSNEVEMTIKTDFRKYDFMDTLNRNSSASCPKIRDTIGEMDCWLNYLISYFSLFLSCLFLRGHCAND